MSQVITFNGTKARKNNCKKINGRFYEKDKQCFKMPDNKWYRINNERITKDYSTNKYVFVSNGLKHGIVKRNNDGSLKYGFFSHDPSINTTIVINSKEVACVNDSIFKNIKNTTEQISTGNVYLDITNEDKKERFQLKRIDKGYTSLFEYRCNSLLNITTKAFDKYFIGKEFKHNFYKHLPNVTFGIEYESDNGRIREDKMMQAGLIPVKDGSLRNKDGTQPYEYATIIHKGKNGMQAISKQCDLLNKYCTQSHFNSLHIHIGGIEISKEYVVTLYSIIKYIQKELFELFPESLKSTRTFKQRDYTNPIRRIRFLPKDIDGNFDLIYKHLGMQDNLKFNGFNAKHPKDPEGTHKWDVHSRYSIVNLVPLLFGPNGTTEFRIHTSTFNKDKVVNWLFITSAICQYAFDNKGKITFSKLRLSHIIKNVYTNNMLNSYLLAYIKYRKKLMIEHKIQLDTIGKFDVESDNINNFNYKFKSLITQWED